MLPFVSFIIPALNAQRFIEKCLISITNLDYPKDRYEIIIVDNGSRDRTVEIVKQYDVRLFSEEGSVSKLRNSGSQKAKGEILAFVDADCVVPNQWLKQALRYLFQDRVGAVGCWYQLSPNPTWVEKAWDIHAGRRREIVGDIDWVPGGNFVIEKKVFDQINSFDECLNTSEDVDICQRIYDAGFIVYSHPEMTVQHLGNPKNVKEFFLKEKWRGEGVLQKFFRGLPLLQFNKALLFTMGVLIFTVLILIGITLWIFGGHRREFIIFSCLSAISLLAMPLVLSLKAIRHDKNICYLLPLTFLFLIYGYARAAALFIPYVYASSFRKERT